MQNYSILFSDQSVIKYNFKFLSVKGGDNFCSCNFSHHFTGQKLASSCSQERTKLVSIYTGNLQLCKLRECGIISRIELSFKFSFAGNERTIVLFLFFESSLMLVLIGLVRFCCTFWAKKKLKNQGLGSFLDKRVSLNLFFFLFPLFELVLLLFLINHIIQSLILCTLIFFIVCIILLLKI